jgi:hypothetical protein
MNVSKQELIKKLKAKEQRGSKPRCHLLTHGTPEEVAARLTQLIAPWGQVRPTDHWLPKGFDILEEAQLHNAHQLLAREISQQLQTWWLSGTSELRTPNWDIASTCLIEGKEGLLLVEAKAHDEELIKEEKGRLLATQPTEGEKINHEHIGKAIREANEELNTLCPGWNLNRDSHYQIVNRFAWSWKLCTLGVPVILVYLGFLNALEMRDRGNELRTGTAWDQLVFSHGKSIIPPNVWNKKFCIKGCLFVPLCRAVEFPLN